MPTVQGTLGLSYPVQLGQPIDTIRLLLLSLLLIMMLQMHGNALRVSSAAGRYNKCGQAKDKQPVTLDMAKYESTQGALSCP